MNPELDPGFLVNPVPGFRKPKIRKYFAVEKDSSRPP
jgi:hypothetical protein